MNAEGILRGREKCTDMSLCTGEEQAKGWRMDKPNYFQSALSSFVTEAACGGAVRHLADLGYTLDQIVARLDYPAPRTKVQRIMMEYLYESHVLLREEPPKSWPVGKAQYIQEQDAYGRRTMRKIRNDYISQFEMTDVPEMTVLPQKPFLWKELVYDRGRDGKLTELLHRKCKENGESLSYISCPFGELDIDPDSRNGERRNTKTVEEVMSCLNGRQREYLQGIRWDQPVLYHRLDQRMREIAGKLYEAKVYGGVCYFIAIQEKITLLP